MKLSTPESIKNIDLKDTKTITILIILCIVLFAIIYVWQNKKNTTERLELKKYNPILKRKTVHKEIK